MAKAAGSTQELEAQIEKAERNARLFEAQAREAEARLRRAKALSELKALNANATDASASKVKPS